MSSELFVSIDFTLKNYSIDCHFHHPLKEVANNGKYAEAHYNRGAKRFFSLKGSDSTAQGNALGTKTENRATPGDALMPHLPRKHPAQQLQLSLLVEVLRYAGVAGLAYGSGAGGVAQEIL